MGQLTRDARPTDQDLTRNFHRDMIAMLAAANDPAVVAEASALFHAAFPPRHQPRPTCARSCTASTDFIDEKLHVLGTLKLKTRSLEWAVARGVRSQDIHSVFGSVAADGSQAKWDALSAQYSQIIVCPSSTSRRYKPSRRSKRSWPGTQGAFARPLGLFFENIRTGAVMYARDMTPLAAWIQTL
ncbi:hypothetical protein H257_17091 [Aphanomyces astaci]|uniref:Uncharacterized protein n=1 Tax=Aphanomyces astaci TaxID=112090 RepID=W4FHT7_APHAT|nr:hypothetical protein H257_17091 [Aphanomyces astaci]ETV66424.1 hypothetical protein H257_17091 [Aphanomyces astaci]|eukprot:XP_009844058.1 hypothetical protein H257_17091 [Aphanomyces astaci]